MHSPYYLYTTNRRKHQTPFFCWKKCTNYLSPFLEHTEKLIGWGQIYEDKTGLKLEDAEISDSETLKRIRSGELKGMSIGGLVRKSKCSLCGLNYLDCNHVTGKIYGGVKCICDIYEVDLAEISVVKYPINPQAKIKEKNDV